MQLIDILKPGTARFVHGRWLAEEANLRVVPFWRSSSECAGTAADEQGNGDSLEAEAVSIDAEEYLRDITTALLAGIKAAQSAFNLARSEAEDLAIAAASDLGLCETMARCQLREAAAEPMRVTEDEYASTLDAALWAAQKGVAVSRLNPNGTETERAVKARELLSEQAFAQHLAIVATQTQ